jgi:hydroxyethylthiazole kinase
MSPREVRWPDPEVVADLAALRAAPPLVHCITNIVAAPLTANVLLAVGAAPAKVMAEEEAGWFAGIAGALLINLGTITPAEEGAMFAAVRAAVAAGKPWVLDPVAVGALSLRTRIAAELARLRPTIIRGNASEILALAGAGAGGRGVDSTDASDAAIGPARALARSTGAVVAVSGVVDYITDGDAVVAVPGGHVLMTRVTGVGCALGAVIGGFAAVAAPPLRAAVSASAVYAAAGEAAGRTARHPGGFAVAFLDALSALG